MNSNKTDKETALEILEAVKRTPKGKPCNAKGHYFTTAKEEVFEVVDCKKVSTGTFVYVVSITKPSYRNGRTDWYRYDCDKFDTLTDAAKYIRRRCKITNL
jgi:hypothetical protein